MLAKFMNVCAKRALGNQIVPKTKTDPSHRDSQETLEENMVSLTTHFATVLPKLLDKFVEEDIIAELVQIPQYFSLDVYATYGFEEVYLKKDKCMKKFSHYSSISKVCLKN